MPAFNSLSPTPVWPVSGGFPPAFFQVLPPEASSATPGSTGRARPQTRYIADLYGSHRDFCRHADFQQFRQEMEANVAYILTFCRQPPTPDAEPMSDTARAPDREPAPDPEPMPDAETIAASFQRFLQHRFELSFFDTHAELVDSVGKQSLDRFCEMLDDPGIPWEKKRTAIRNLSEGVGVCASGVVSNLIAAERDLTMSLGGFRSALWKMKEEVTCGVLQKAVASEFGHSDTYARNEIHHVNAAWNYIADSIGLPAIPDWMASSLSIEFLEVCRGQVLAALTPHNIAGLMAEQCLARFVDQVADSSVRPAGICTVAIAEKLNDAVRFICRDLGLDNNQLNLHAFVSLDGNDGGYRLRQDHALVSWALLKVMKAESLLNDAPRNEGKGQDENGEPFVLLSYGTDLAWRARVEDESSVLASESEWNQYVDVEALTMPALLAWSQARRGQDPSLSARRQAIRGSDSVDLVRTPVRWVCTGKIMLELLSRFGDGQFQDYLQDNLSYLLVQYPGRGRPGLIAYAVGRGWVSWELLLGWKLDALDILESPCDGGDISISWLQYWMVNGDARAIDALADIALRDLDSLSTKEDPHSTLEGYTLYLCRVLRGHQHRPALNEAMAADRGNAIDAWRRLAAHPKLSSCLKTYFPELLKGVDRFGCPALARALIKGGASGITAYCCLLAHPEVNPHIRDDLEVLVTAAPDGDIAGQRMRPALFYAMQLGHVEAIKAYHAMLAHPAIAPHIVKMLPKILTGTPFSHFPSEQEKGESCLAAALRNGRAQAIRAFHALLTDPVIFPHIRGELAELLAARNELNVAGLAYALGYGHREAVSAFDEMLDDQAIAACIENEMDTLRSAGGVRPVDDVAWYADLLFIRAARQRGD